MNLTKNEILFNLLKIVKNDIKKDENIENLIIDKEQLKQREIIYKLMELIPKLKTKYNSNMLNCLHRNSLSKQKFPAVNMLRQILKCNNYKLDPYVICNGYNKSNGKKIVERKYKIKLMNK